jgi:hypothetical protein
MLFLLEWNHHWHCTSTIKKARVTVEFKCGTRLKTNKCTEDRVSLGMKLGGYCQMCYQKQVSTELKVNNRKKRCRTSAIEWPYFKIHCVFFSADFSAVSAVTSLCAVFFETDSLVGFVVLEFPWDFLQYARKLAQDPPTQHNNNISETSRLSQVETSSFLQTSPPCRELQSIAH